MIAELVLRNGETRLIKISDKLHKLPTPATAQTASRGEGEPESNDAA